MVSRGKLGHHTSELGVHRCLTMNGMRLKSMMAVVDGDSGLVA
jgi:hypothetical protein